MKAHCYASIQASEEERSVTRHNRSKQIIVPIPDTSTTHLSELRGTWLGRPEKERAQAHVLYTSPLCVCRQSVKTLSFLVVETCRET